MNEQIARAVEILRGGGLVAIPTETVYGLAADATNESAVRRLFEVKGRPATNPVIVHVSDANVARRYAGQWPEPADKLARAFWPGPLTLVVPKSQAIVPQVTAGLATVGLRSPDHPLTLELLRAFDGALAAPSANRSNRVSPTTAEHVRQELGSAVDLVLDGGPCQVGIESTVLDLTRQPPAILRPGAVTRDEIAAVIGGVDVEEGTAPADQPAASPGRQAVHYAPTTPAYRFALDEAPRVVAWCRQHPHERAAFLLLDSIVGMGFIKPAMSPAHVLVPMPATPVGYARELYAELRRADAMDVGAIFLELPPATSRWAGARDRVWRATREISDVQRTTVPAAPANGVRGL
jgi:L-threonylcarbamoyladenylate synthase